MNAPTTPANLAPASAPAITWQPLTHALGYAELFQQFAEGAAERDVQQRLLFDETAALKARGFGALRLPKTQGGQGLSLPELFTVARDLAVADPNLAHVFRNHFFAVEQHVRTPADPFSRHVLDLVSQRKSLGVAFNEQTGEPAGQVGQKQATLLHRTEDGGWQVSGTKLYSTGNLYADYLFSSAAEADSGRVRQFFVATNAPGVHLDDDWDGFGQKLTGSGRTIFRDVAVAPDALFDVPPRAPEGEPIPYGYTFHQVFLTTVISGIVERVLVDALGVVHRRHRNFYHGLAERPADEPEIQATIGRIAAYRSAVRAVTERAVQALDQAWADFGTPAQQASGLASTLAASEAKVVTDDVAAQLASLLIDVGSGSVVSRQAALDRHWRNIKVIASHNPRTYKERVLGDYYLNGTLPPTGAFF